MAPEHEHTALRRDLQPNQTKTAQQQWRKQKHDVILPRLKHGNIPKCAVRETNSKRGSSQINHALGRLHITQFERARLRDENRFITDASVTCPGLAYTATRRSGRRVTCLGFHTRPSPHVFTKSPVNVCGSAPGRGFIASATTQTQRNPTLRRRETTYECERRASWTMKTYQYHTFEGTRPTNPGFLRPCRNTTWNKPNPKQPQNARYTLQQAPFLALQYGS
jgi:hypothetical protein